MLSLSYEYRIYFSKMLTLKSHLIETFFKGSD